jgi:hypothetical protein
VRGRRIMMTLKLTQPYDCYGAGTICKVLLRVKVGSRRSCKVRFADGREFMIPTKILRELAPLEQLACEGRN